MTGRPVLSAKEVVTILRKLGFEEVRQRGSHEESPEGAP